MLDAFFIFGAQHLFILSVLTAIAVFLKVPREEKKRMAMFFALFLPLALILSLALREIYFNPRPFVAGGFEPLIPHAPDNGFPSDHALLVSSLAAGIMYFNKRASLALWAIAIIVGLSRVYVGVHHLIDIIGAIAVSLVSAFAVHVFLKRRANGTMSEITNSNGKQQQ